MSASSMGITAIDPIGVSSIGSPTVTLTPMTAIKEEGGENGKYAHFIGDEHHRGQKSLDLIADEAKFVVLIDSDDKKKKSTL